MQKIKDTFGVIVFILGGLSILSAFISDGLSLWGRIRDIVLGLALWSALIFPVVRNICIFLLASFITLSNIVLMINGVTTLNLISVIFTVIGALFSFYFFTRMLRDLAPRSTLSHGPPGNDVIISSSEDLRAFYDTHSLVDTISTKVVGVSFRNRDGSSRQDILSLCGVGDEVYLEYFLYEGKPAYAVSTSRGQIGNLPAHLSKRIDREYDGCTIHGLITDLTGGSSGLYYGCYIHLSVFREKPASPCAEPPRSIRPSIPAKDIVYPNSRKRQKDKSPSVDSGFIAEAQWYAARGGSDPEDGE